VERGYRRKENEFLASSLRRSEFLVSPSYRSRKVGSSLLLIALLADQGQTKRSLYLQTKDRPTDQFFIGNRLRSLFRDSESQIKFFSRWVSMERGYSIAGRRMSFFPLFT
jgi:hypothetical protein